MRKLLWFSTGFTLASLLAVYALPEAWLPWCALGGLLLVVLALVVLRLRRSGSLPLRVRATPSIRVVSCCLLGLAIGLLWCWGYAAVKLAPAHEVGGKYPALTAELCDYPVETYYGHRADAWAELPEGRYKTRLYLYGPLPEVEPGDRITGSFTLRRADRDLSGDTWLDLQARGILLTASGRVSASESGGAPFRYFPARWSRAIYDRLGALIPADAAALPRAMLTGSREDLSEADRDALSGAGASHIVAVSGLHVAMLLGALVLIVGRGRLCSVLGLPLLLLFVLMTGASPSVVRAALMLSLFLLASLFREENDPPSSLAFAALLILLENPWAAANVSFQLSFAAVAGLLLVTKALREYLLALGPVKGLLAWKGPKALPQLPKGLLLRFLHWLIRFLIGSFSASLGVLCFSTPIAAAHFGSVPVYGVLTNLLVLPLATACLWGTLAVLLLGLVSTSLGSWAGRLLAWPVRWIFGISRAVSGLPGHLLYPDFWGKAFLILCVLLLLLAFLRRRKQRYGLPLLGLLAALAVTIGLQHVQNSVGQFTLAALDVGQGQCVCMVTSSCAVMTDCGGSGGPQPGRTAAAWLRKKGVDRLDALILTHYDTDHICGVEALLSLVPVKAVYLPDVEFDPENRAAVEKAALDAGADLHYVNSDLTLSFADSTVRLYAPVSDRNDNAACVSVLYSAAEYDMLITGDLDARGEAALAEQKDLPPVELYVAGHHGSAKSSSQLLLDTIRPYTVLISVGRNNYGLPNEEALARIEACGAQIYRTDECGTLEIGR